MAWIELKSDTLTSRLTNAELSALGTAATDVSDVLEVIAGEVANEWRGALARVVALDTRSRAVPAEVMIHVLADYRYRAFTRLPGMEALLDVFRVEEWRRANHIRDNLGKIQIEPPEPPNAPDDPNAGTPLPAFCVPPHILD